MNKCFNTESNILSDTDSTSGIPVSPIEKMMTTKEINIIKGVFLTQQYSSADQRKSLKEIYEYLVTNFFKDREIAEMEKAYLHLVQTMQLPEYLSPKEKAMTREEMNIVKGVFLTQQYSSVDQRKSSKEIYEYLVTNFFKDREIAEMEKAHLHLVETGQL